MRGHRFNPQAATYRLLDMVLNAPRLAHSGLSAGLLIQRTEFDPRTRRNLLNRKRSSIAHSLSLSASHRPDMTEILFKGT